MLHVSEQIIQRKFTINNITMYNVLIKLQFRFVWNGRQCQKLHPIELYQQFFRRFLDDNHTRRSVGWDQPLRDLMDKRL